MPGANAAAARRRRRTRSGPAPSTRGRPSTSGSARRRCRPCRRRGPPARARPTTAPPRARGAGSRRPTVVVAARPQHGAVRVDQHRPERSVPGLERLAGEHHARPQVSQVLLRDQATGHSLCTRTCSSSGLVCRACNRCGSSSGPPATSVAGRCTRSSAATTWSSSASTPTARTRSARTRPSCAAGRSRPACWRRTTSRRCWRWSRMPAATTRSGRASTSWSRCWRPASTSAPAPRGSPAASRATPIAAASWTPASRGSRRSSARARTRA